MKYFFLPVLLLCSTFVLSAQETFPTNGVVDTRPELYALINATIIVSPTTRIDHGTIVVRKGMIEAVGGTVSIPKDAAIYDMNGRWIYPSFIDLDADYGMPEIKAEPPRTDGDGPQMESKVRGAFGWNQALKPEVEAYKLFTSQAQKAEEWRKAGFGAVLTYPHDGVARGTSVFVSLADGKENPMILKDKVAAHYSFNKGTSTQDYPSSLMGTIALLRQTYLDAAWYKQSKTKTDYNISLEAWNANQSLPQMFTVEDKLNALRADKIGDEVGVQYIIRGSGDEYERINEIKATKASFIIPINFPLPYDVSDPFDAMALTLEQMKKWELAPTNPAVLEKAGIPFALTSAQLKDKSKFLENIRAAIRYGLSKQKALEAVTITPASLIGMSAKIGILEPGMIANMLITSGDIFSKGTVITENWVQGKRYEIEHPGVADLRGTYVLTVGNLTPMTLTISGTTTEPKVEFQQDTAKRPMTFSHTDRLVTLRFKLGDSTSGDIRLSGWMNDSTWEGRGQLGNGEWIPWSAHLTRRTTEPQKPDTLEPVGELGALTYPNMEYGWEELPKAEKVLIKNATVWTNEKDGIMPNTDVLLDGGKIAAIGKDMSTAGARVIDGTGKHLTAGVIDEHSHIAASGDVNEGTEAISAEVRIADIVDCDDIQIYRQLAGGVTTSHILHGSANPVGGQTQLLKLRWGMPPEALKFEGADGFIKFALGENVKQSNWGDKSIIRFPQTRMGVEQVYIDGFTRAREYENGLKSPGDKGPVRHDLRLDALVEILNSKRFITCHSYVQSEITMLMRVAEQFGFRVNTFTHILEGYKVADKMKKHGAGGSTFSDWWAYKYEVIDAIPYNGAIMHDMGITTAFNSDSPEMARRLNQEAAKAVKYGGVSEEEAWKCVTLNPAKLLHIDNRVGSIKAGKDADVVVWSDNPLSIYAHAEQTFVDGVCYYDMNVDKQKQEDIEHERTRLIQKMLDEKHKGVPTQKPVKKEKKIFHCEDGEHGEE